MNTVPVRLWVACRFGDEEEIQYDNLLEMYINVGMAAYGGHIDSWNFSDHSPVFQPDSDLKVTGSFAVVDTTLFSAGFTDCPRPPTFENP